MESIWDGVVLLSILLSYHFVDNFTLNSASDVLLFYPAQLHVRRKDKHIRGMFVAADVWFDPQNNGSFPTFELGSTTAVAVFWVSQVVDITLGSAGNKIANVHLNSPLIS